MSSPFRLTSGFEPKGDQPRAIEQLVAGLGRSERHQVLLGITGSGKTFTIANVIQQTGRAHAHSRPQQDARCPALRRDARALPRERGRVLRQLLRLLPARGVHPVDRHVHRQGRDHQRPDRPDAPLGDRRAPLAPRRHHRRERQLHLRHRQRGELPRPRHPARRAAKSFAATRSFASWSTSSTSATTSTSIAARFRVRGDVVEIFPTYEQETAIRIEFFGDDIESIKEVDPLRGRVKGTLERYAIYPGSHYVTPQAQMRRAIEGIREELRDRLDFYDKEGRFLEKQRLEQRTLYDLELHGADGLLLGHRELLAAPLGSQAGRGAADAHRLLPAGLPDGPRRVAPDRPAGPGDVPGRPRAKRDAGRVRLPSAQRARQPARSSSRSSRTTCARRIYVSATPGEYELAEGAGASSSSS